MLNILIIGRRQQVTSPRQLSLNVLLLSCGAAGDIKAKFLRVKGKITVYRRRVSNPRIMHGKTNMLQLQAGHSSVQLSESQHYAVQRREPSSFVLLAFELFTVAGFFPPNWSCTLTTPCLRCKNFMEWTGRMQVLR